MQNHDEIPVESEAESTAFSIAYEADDDWSNYKDSDVMQQQSAIFEQDAAKFPFVGDKVIETWFYKWFFPVNNLNPF